MLEQISIGSGTSVKHGVSARLSHCDKGALVPMWVAKAFEDG